MVSASTVVLVGIGAAAILSVALLSVERPPLTGRTVLAVAPWAVVAGTLHALAAVGAYPPAFTGFLRFPGALVVTFVVATLVWTPLLQLATLRDFQPGTAQYLAAAGGGTAVVLLVVLLLRQGLSPRGFLWLAATPLLAAIVTSVAYFLLGFVDPTTLATTRWVGYLVTLGVTTLGATLAVAIDVYGATPGSLVRPVVRIASDLPTAGTSVGWPLAVLAALLGLALAAVVARVVRERPLYGYLVAVAVSVGALAPAAGHLLLVTLG